MEIALLVIGILGLVPIGYWVYSTYIRKPHSIDFELGNIALARVASPNRNRDGKLALIMYSLALVNRGPTSLTIKSVLLAYRFEGLERQAELTDVPTGTVDGVSAIALANTSDNIVIAWSNLRETLGQDVALQPGAVLKGSAVFLLDVPISRLRDISALILVVGDYSGGRSTHELTPEDRWYQVHEKNFSLMDAPVTKTGDHVHWQDIMVTTQKPA